MVRCYKAMSTAKLILVTGAPATGKTTIAKAIAERVDLPFLCKDDIKELLFDTIGWSDRAWSRKLGVATYRIMYYMLERQLEAHKSLIMESDFRPAFDEPKLRALKEQFQFGSLIIHCTAEASVLLERFKERLTSGKRHPGHNDQENYKLFMPETLKNDFGTLAIGGESYELDTTNFSTIDLENLWPRVETFLTA